MGIWFREYENAFKASGISRFIEGGSGPPFVGLKASSACASPRVLERTRFALFIARDIFLRVPAFMEAGGRGGP